jgi:drug/metabolite transporter (DMT)-like permease
MNKTSAKDIVELNFSVILISSAAVLVRFIPLNPTQISFWRGVIAFITIGIVMLIKKTSFRISSKNDRARLFTSSVLFALHWISYFYALQVSSVAIGMLSLFTFPVITAIIEPIYFKTKFNKRHLILAVLVFIGLYVMAPEINFENNSTKGIVSGVLSGLFFALRNLTMKSNASKYKGSVLMFYQFLFIGILFCPFLFLNEKSQTIKFMPYILCLGIFATAIGHTIFVKSLKKFEVTTASIIASSQPVFGILMGLIFLNEIPNAQTFAGGVLIISSVFIEIYTKNKTE